MAVLATELFNEIGYHLVLDINDRQRAQAALAALCLSNKAFRDIFTPHLYRNPVLRQPAQVKSWARTVVSTGATPVVEGQSRIRSLKPEKLFILGPKGPAPQVFHLSYLHKRANTTFSLPDFTQPLRAGLFANLTTLKLVNVFASHHFLATLLGPDTTVRKRIEVFTLYASNNDRVIPELELQFLFEVIKYGDLDMCSNLWQGKDDANFGERYRGTEDEAEVTKAILDEAHSDVSTLSKLWTGDIADSWGSMEAIVHTINPTSISPWDQLKTLDLQILSSEALCLIFQTTAFPSLRRVTLHGQSGDVLPIDREVLLTFRIAVNSLDKPGKLLEPELEFYDDPDIDVELAGWGPPTSKELDSYSYKPYRGPKLEYLDLSRFTVMLPW